MTLDEAIKHCYERAEENRGRAELYVAVKATEKKIQECEECANDHEQLAEWLTELKYWQKLKLVCAFDGYVIYKEADNGSKESN